MSDLEVQVWPPSSIVSERLLVREMRLADLDECVQLLTAAEVRSYLGGPLPVDRAREVAEAHLGRPGAFAVTAADHFLGTVVLNRRDRARPGHLDPVQGDELEISYTFLPEYWGNGYAGEAVNAVLGWAVVTLPDALVVLCTQTENTRSVRLAERLGFAEVARFEEFGAEQWFGVRALQRPAPGVPPGR